MLAIPESGVRRSVTQHNNELSVLSDWVEASILFKRDELSRSDIVDILLENDLYDSQDFANERVDQIWSVVTERIRYLQLPLGMKVESNRITRQEAWTRFPAYGFCMTLALSFLYPAWAKKWDGVPTIYGAMFEELAEQSLANCLTGWSVKRIGWTPETPTKLKTELPHLIADINEREGAESNVHVTAHTNELGLDLLAYRSFEDSHSSFPVLLVQCASGKNWESKRKTPDLEIWRKVINFNSPPLKGFAIPFAFADQLEFRRLATPVAGVFFDRNRLLGAIRRGTRVPGKLNKRMKAWTQKQVNALTAHNA